MALLGKAPWMALPAFDTCAIQDDLSVCTVQNHRESSTGQRSTYSKLLTTLGQLVLIEASQLVCAEQRRQFTRLKLFRMRSRG